METAKIIQDGDQQAVLLPDKYRLSCSEVAVQQSGPSLILTPTDKTDNSLFSQKTQTTV